MAHLEYTREHTAYHPCNRTSLRPSVALLPRIIWNDGKPWKEANHWANDQAGAQGTKKQVTVHRMVSLCQYADWLEQENLHWMQFPENQVDCVLFQYQKALLNRVIRGEYHRARAFVNFRAVLSFYASYACRSPKKNKRLLEAIQPSVLLEFRELIISSVIVKYRVKRDG